MTVDPMFWLAIAAFAWGLSLATYRWFALYNGWPMGAWQAHRPGLPVGIGVLCVLLAMLFAYARGGETLVVIPLLGIVLAYGWTSLTRVAAQSALLLAPIATAVLVTIWVTAASHLGITSGDLRVHPSLHGGAFAPAATDREGRVSERDRGITFEQPRVLPPLSR
jgi:hypothetical protein